MASYNAKNPIRTVDNAYIPVPSSYQVEYNDVSQPDAGRTEDGTMHKLRLGTARKISLEWQNIRTTVAAEILAAFQPEYVLVTFFDPRSATTSALPDGQYATREFYVGDRSCKFYNNSLGHKVGNKTEYGVMTVSFNLIERSLPQLELPVQNS